MTEQRYRQLVHEGFNANFAGRPETDNPYVDPDENAAWWFGWDTAESMADYIDESA